MSTRRRKAGTSKESAEHRMALFVEAYIANSGNATDAAIEAGYSAKTAYSAGPRLLKNVEVSAEIGKRRAEVLQQCMLTTERTLQQVARLSFFDIRKLYRDDGTLKKPIEWDDDTAAAVASAPFLFT